MKRCLKYLIIVTLSTICVSCFKEDDQINLPVTNGIVRTIELGENYDNQLYFNLSEDSIIASNIITEWDLAFECDPSGWHVLLNSSRFMLAANTHSTNFDSIFSLDSLIWRWDNPNGKLDSVALYDWANFTVFSNPFYNKYVYIIDRGASQTGESYGHKKLLVESLENGAYSIRYANLDGSDEHTAIINKDTALNYVQFSFDMNATVPLEPSKNSWDLLFTRYTYAFYQGDPDAPFSFDGDYLLYPVAGVLINGNNTQSTNALNSSYELIDSTMVDDYFLSTDMDAIGWNWKQFTGTRYVIVPNRCYVVCTNSGSYFKLRFIGYYNNLGIKGYPKIEFEKIK